jgi:hypoxanthine phosphoribosyltransferase
LFLADLVRQLRIPCEVDFLALSAYAPDSGRVRLVKDLDTDLTDRDVVLVEDVVDTGLTLTWLRAELGRRGVRSLAACTLFDRTVRRLVPVPIEYVGFVVGDEYLLGYGLDFAGRYRNLDHVVAADPAALAADPDAHVPELYGG